MHRDSNEQQTSESRLRKRLPVGLRLHGRVLADTTKKRLGISIKPGSQTGLRQIAARLSRSWSSREVFREPQFKGRELTYTVPILGSSINILVLNTGDRFSVGVFGDTPLARHWLNDMVVTDSRLVVDATGREVHVFETSVEPMGAVHAVGNVYNLIANLRSREEHGEFPDDEFVRAYWASKVINFGDWLGPHLIKRISGRRPVRENRPGAEGNILYSVGSILGWITRSNGDVWGSGLIRPLTDSEISSRKQLKNLSIHAVRGRLTREHLIDRLGWEVPEVYGDPALLLPRFYQPEVEKTQKIAFTPHGVHRKYFDKALPNSVENVHVRRDFRDVTDTIASSRAVISTSLHGLITAQAYGIPWIWLNINDHGLWGDDFKFNDFFSTIDSNAVAIETVASKELASLDFESIAKKASLPESSIDLDLLERACPLSDLTSE